MNNLGNFSTFTLPIIQVKAAPSWSKTGRKIKEGKEVTRLLFGSQQDSRFAIRLKTQNTFKAIEKIRLAYKLENTAFDEKTRYILAVSNETCYLIKIKSAVKRLHLTNEDIQALKIYPYHTLGVLNKRANELSRVILSYEQMIKNFSIVKDAYTKNKVLRSYAPYSTITTFSPSTLMKVIDTLLTCEPYLAQLNLTRTVAHVQQATFYKNFIDSHRLICRLTQDNQLDLLFIEKK